jgi:hypothetical protein
LTVEVFNRIGREHAMSEMSNERPVVTKSNKDRIRGGVTGQTSAMW